MVTIIETSTKHEKQRPRHQCCQLFNTEAKEYFCVRMMDVYSNVVVYCVMPFTDWMVSNICQHQLLY